MSATRPPGRQLPWFLLTGLVIGFIAGLAWSWWGDPVQYQNVSPAGLRADYRADLRGLVALAYAASGDVGRARARLVELGDKDPISALEDQAAGLQRDDLLPDVSNAMVDLAEELRTSPVGEVSELASADTPLPEDTQTGQTGKLTQTKAPAQATTRGSGGAPTAAQTPLATFTPRPTHTPSATPGAPFALVENVPTCEPARPGLMAITVLDAAGQGASAIPILVTWQGGQDLFFTGLAPEINPGFADFVMTAGLIYTVRVGESGIPVGDLQAQECPAGLGGLVLTFRQP